MSRRRMARLLSRCRAHHLSFSQESHRRTPFPRTRAYLSRRILSISQRAPDCWPKKNPAAKLALAYVSYVTPDRPSIYRAIVYNVYDDNRGTVRPTGREIRSLMIDESRTNVTSSLGDTLLLLALLLMFNRSRNNDFLSS